MVTMMIVVGAAALLLGIVRTISFMAVTAGHAETATSQRLEGMLLNMVLLVFGLLVFGLGMLWQVVGLGS